MKFEDETLGKYIHSSIDDDFGLDIDTVAKNVHNGGRFKAWLGGDLSATKKVLQIVKDEGMSPAFFGAYEISEGYNASWGWLNWTSPTGDAYTDARNVARHMISVSNDKTKNPSFVDYGNPVYFVPQSVQNEGLEDFQSMPAGTIGRALIPSTAAATWEVYYPKGLDPAYNGVQWYGKPITSQYKNILSWGGEIDGKRDSNSSSGGSSSGGTSGSISQLINGLIEKVEDMLQWNMYSNVSDMYYFNHWFTIMKTYNNTYKLQFNLPMIEDLKKFISSFDLINGGSSDNKDNDDGKPSDNEGDINTCNLHLDRGIMQWYYPTVQDAIANGYPMKQAHLGMDFRMTDEPLYSVASGVAYTQPYYPNPNGATGWGKYIVLYMDNGDALLFAHLSEVLIENGSKVNTNDKIAITGQTGAESITGFPNQHLHMEYIPNFDKSHGIAVPNGSVVPRINPIDFVVKHCSKIKSKDDLVKNSTVY